ncbi:MAG: NAD-dependent epimerase/dehydratase family protein [Candidatus Cloacimonadia bacterium]
MKFLITGGAGFIGSHLCEKLLDLGHQVVCLDNFNDAYDPQIKRENVTKCLASNRVATLEEPRYVLIEGDLRDEQRLEEIFSKHSIDVVIHLAAMAGVRPSIANPILYYDVNVTGTLNLLEKCRTYHIDKFIFASSSSVYGNNEKVPFEETDPVDNPISPYAATKKSGELLCYTYHHLYKTSIACLRFFTVYGPRQRPDLAIHKFAKKMLNDEPIQLYGDGKSTRDYTYIDDIIDGIVKSIDFVSNKTAYEIFNLGECQAIRLDKMIHLLEKVLGKEALIERLPHQEGDVYHTCASIEKSKRVLGYSPDTEFEEGLKIFADWLLKK